MASKVTSPRLGGESFNCPTCGAFSHQEWFNAFATGCSSDGLPFVPAADAPERVKASEQLEDKEKKALASYYEKRLKTLPFLDRNDAYASFRLENVYVSRCFSCKSLAVWVYDRILFPSINIEIEPNADLNDDIRLDFLEAVKLLAISPRGSAALLRLCIQKVCIQLGQPGKNINDDIAALV